MKAKLWFKVITCARSGLLVLALSGLAGVTEAQTFVNPKTFDTSIGSWITWNGWGIQGFLSLDPALDAASDPNSGSLRYDVPFVGDSGEQFMTFGTFADRWGWDGGTILNIIGNYKNLVLDLRIDPSTAVTKNGNYGPLELGFTTDGWGQVYVTNFTLPSTISGNWTHIVVPIDQTKAGLEKANGYFIKMWSDGAYTNTMSFNVDNVWLQPSTNEPPPPPPTMALSEAGTPGVQIIMDDDSAQWQRNAIVTPSGGGPYMWTSQGSYPVTYSMTITNFPDPVQHPGFEAHMYLVNQDTSNGQETSGSPDWGVPDLFILRIENRAAGDVSAQIQWKTNYPNSNATNFPLTVLAPSAVGTWTVTFTDSTSGTLSGPGLATTNFSMPGDVVQSSFSPATSFLQFGMFKNDGVPDGHNNGAYGTFSHVKFTGAAAAFEDDFSGSTLTNKYEWRKTSATAVQYVTPDAAWLVDWTLPAVGFSAQMAPAVNGPWTNAVFASTYTGGRKVHGLVSSTALPPGNAAFFRMISRPFVKLQVLMPGETAAPNTPTGKTGTPDPQTAGVPFNITVNAVDEVWNRVISATDTITITSSDDTAALPTDTALMNGTATLSVTFNNFGTFTVTATDVTDAAKTANTSTPTVAQ